jgi:LysM repeat protein
MDRVEKVLVFVVVATIVVIVTLALSNSGDDLVEGIEAEMRAEGLDAEDGQNLPIEVVDDETGFLDLPDLPEVLKAVSPGANAAPATVPAAEVEPLESEPKAEPSTSPSGASAKELAAAPRKEKSASKPARPRWNDRYVVRKNDSFWNIAERVYGHGKYWQKIRAANLDVDPYNLMPETVLVLPELKTSVKAVREPKLEMQGEGASPFRTVTLKKGEYLYKVLRREGLTRRLSQVLALNGLDEESAEHLQEGYKLKIPRN